MGRADDAVVSTLVRDPWSDAYQAATAENLDAEVSAVRRRLRVRRTAGLLLSVAAFSAAYILLDHLFDPDAPELWRVSALWPSRSLIGLGCVLMVVGAVRTSGANRPFVGPDDFLSRADRTWLRTQIAENRPVAAERHAVVTAAARRMVVEGRYLPGYLGLTALYVGFVVGAPILSLLVMFSGLTVWVWVRAARGAIWSRRARRWRAQHS
jgi:hypothetical protein